MQINVTPIRRNLKFHLPRHAISNWHTAGPVFTQFMNTLSIFFPEGEKFFIDSVRLYRGQITDPALQEEVRAFIGQEAFHSREHIDYNEALAASGIPVAQYEEVVRRLLKTVQKTTPASFQLAATIALEHLTAILANGLLEDQDDMASCEEHYALLWQWHALEETEHKAVAFDVYRQVMGSGPGAYSLRIGAFVAANLIFWSIVIPYHLDIVRREKQLFNWRGWVSTLQMQWGKPGILRRIIPDWLDYFKPDFHPWQHDNREYLSKVDDLLERLAVLNDAHEKAGAGTGRSAQSAATSHQPKLKDQAASTTVVAGY